MIVAAHLVSTSGGHGDARPLVAAQTPVAQNNLADGVDEIRRVVRTEVSRGSQWIKFGATGGFASPADDPSQVPYSQAEIDAIVATARAGNFETSQFAAAIGRVLPFAQQAGASFQDMGGAVALLTRVNGDAAQSVTQIQALFRAFVVPTEEAKKALDGVGLSAADLRDSIAKEGLPATLAMLDQALGGNREELGRLLGSSEAASAAFQILESDAQTINDTFGVVASSAGMTAEAFDVMAGTTQFQLNQAMQELKAALIDLGNSMLPVVQAVIDFASRWIKAFNSLPGPLKNVITAFAALAAVVGPLLLVMGKLIVVGSTLLSFMLKLKAIQQLRAVFMGLRAELALTRASMTQTQASMGMLGTAASMAKITVVSSFRAIGVAAKGLMAAFGPIGIALIGFTVIMDKVVGASAAADEMVSKLIDTVDAATGKLTELSAAVMAEKFRLDLSPEDVKLLAELGISVDEAAFALSKGGAAAEEFQAKIDAAQASVAQGFHLLPSQSANLLKVFEENYAGMGSIAEDTLTQVAAKNDSVAAAQNRNMSATVQAAIAAGNAVEPNKSLASSLVEVTDAAGNVITEMDAMTAEYNEWLAVTGQISAVDQAATSIDRLGASAVEFGTNLMGQTPKARDFRADVISAFEDSARAAQSLSDDLPTQRAIFTGELIKIVNALKASGVKPKDIQAFLGAMDGLPASVSDIMRSAAKAIGDTDFKDPIEKAFDKSVKAGAPMTADAMARLAEGASGAAKAELGLTLEPELASIIKSGTTALRPTAFRNGELTGRSIGSGAAFGINQSSPIVQAAVARVMAQAKAAADAAVESDSPSKLFARTGDDIVAGLAMGITRSTRSVVVVMSKAARLFTRAFMDDFMPKEMGAAETAITNAIAGAEQVLAEARDRLKQSNTALKDAEQELNRLRKDEDSTAKDIARAEKELAKAREEAAKAAKDVKIAEWVKSNENALNALQKIAKQYDYIVGRMEGVESAFASITSLLATPLGTASDLSQMFQFGTDPRTLARNYMGLADTIREAYAVMTDPAIVGEGAARRNTAAMNATLSQLESYVTQIIALESEYAANAEQMRVNEQKYRVDEEKLRESLSGSVRAYEDATRELERIVNERDGFIDKINSGFRSFVNNLSGLTQDSVSVVTEEVRELGSGVRTIVRSTRQEMQSGAGAIAETLRSRLDEVKAFSSNIQSLMRRGLDPTLIRDFIEAGVSGAGEAVAALASATDDELRGINDTQAELLKYANEFAGGVSGAYYSSAISAQEAIVRDTKAAVTAAQKDLDDAKEAYDVERRRLEGEQARIETDINTLVTQIESLITGMMTTLVPATEAAAQKSLDAMIAQFKKDFPKVSAELNRLMDALAKSMERTVKIAIEPVRAGATTRAGITSVTDVPATVTTGGVPAPSANVTYQITVNTGVGDPREIGRVTVEAIKAYERSNGRVFASA
jgi:TP901 family phage tail tape measure protein